MAKQTHVEWLKEGVSRWNRRRKRISFEPDLSDVSFFDLLPDDFRDAPKTSRTFEGIDLSNANLNGADLSNSNFFRANFRNATFEGADLSRSNFESAKFVKSQVSHANLSMSSFRNAIFEDASIEEVVLEGAEMDGASFVSVETSSMQKRVLEARGGEFFTSRAAYRDSQEVQRFHARTDEAQRQESIAKIDARTRKNRYDVFFGTNREPIFQQDALVDFGSGVSNEIHFGLAEVIVPEGRPVGSLGKPLWKKLLNLKDDSLRIDNIIRLDEELFFSHLEQNAARMRIAERPTIFVHGYNNTFKAAVLRAAQVGYDLGIGQGVGLFSWPSKAKKLGYLADERAAESSKYLLAEFIEKFIEKTPAGSVNVIAHSMGCRCLLGALEVMSNGRTKNLKRVNQVILAAADVDTSIMPSLGQAATKYATRTTSYVSGKDQALKLSGWFHSFPRVGLLPPTFVMSGMDTILVNNDDLGAFSHGYVGTSRTVLSDINRVLSDNTDPDSRFSLVASGQGFWRMRE